jgi:uncharacterized protein
MMRHIFYHANCLDGLMSAAVAVSRFKSQGFEYATHPVGYEAFTELDILSKIALEDFVYVLDFSFPLELSRKLEKESAFFITIDHHVSAQEKLNGEPYFLYFPDMCGATATWDWFYYKQEIPQVLKYVEDRDLWKFALPETKAVCKGLELTTLGEVEKAISILATGLTSEAYIVGKTFTAWQAKLVKEHAEEQSYLVELNLPCTVAACNAPKFLASELGNLLAEKHFGIAIVYSLDDRWVNCSARSVEGSICSAKEVAERYGGGGHRHAAGFSVKRDSAVGMKILNC